MNNKISPQIQWLKKTHSATEWRLVTPNIKNPFDSNAEDLKLEEYSRDRSTLAEVCKVQAFIDNVLLIKITDLVHFNFDTEHPNLVNLQNSDLEDYLRSCGVLDMIKKELDKFQASCAAELQNRRGEHSESAF